MYFKHSTQGLGSFIRCLVLATHLQMLTEVGETAYNWSE